MRTEKEIKNKYKDYSIEAINFAINRLKKEGYLNNDIYLKSYINDEIKFKISGPYKITIDLVELGFQESDINEYLDNIDNKIWTTKINNYLAKAINNNRTKSNKELLIKIKQDLINKGFDISLIKESLENIIFKDDSDLLKKEFHKLYEKYHLKYDSDKLKYLLLSKLSQKGYSREDIDILWQEKTSK